MRSFVIGLAALTAVSFPLVAQNEAKELKPLPHKNETFLYLVNEAVVQVQWPHTLKLVNPPQNITLLNPGQCIRVGVVATGDNRDSYLEKTKLSFRVKNSGQTQNHPLASLAQFKQMKPEGGDFVTAALAAGGIKNPLLTTATMGVSADNWCAPADASDRETAFAPSRILFASLPCPAAYRADPGLHGQRLFAGISINRISAGEPAGRVAAG